MPLTKQEQWALEAQTVMDMQFAEIENLKKELAAERERCANIAQHLNGWGSPPAPKLAAHIATCIRNQK